MIILARQRAHRDALKAAAGGRQLTRLELKEGIVQGGLERSSLCTLFFLCSARLKSTYLFLSNEAAPFFSGTPFSV